MCPFYFFLLSGQKIQNVDFEYLGPLCSECRHWVRPGELMTMTSKRPLDMPIGARLYGACVG